MKYQLFQQAVKKSLKDTLIKAFWMVIFTFLMHIFWPSVLAYITHYTLNMSIFILTYFSVSIYKYYRQLQNA